MVVIESIAKCYVDINKNMPKSYWDYNSYEIKWKSCEPYILLTKIGRGKYSDVFQGIDNRTGQKLCIKTLKAVRKKKIKREIKILKNLQGGPNIVNFYEGVRDYESGTRALIFEYINNKNFKELYPRLLDIDVRYYTYELLKALDYCHSKGIIHRDVKPHNVMIDHDKRIITLVDWGLAEFYHAKQLYNVRVASRYFKGPELLVNFQMYDYSLDIWSVGCMLAGMIFRREPFFHGRDNNDQLVKIVRVLGTSEFEIYLNKYNITLSPLLENQLMYIQWNKKPWIHFINSENKQFINNEIINFIDSCLQYDHNRRPTAKEAMTHIVFSEIREMERKQIGPYKIRNRKYEI